MQAAQMRLAWRTDISETYGALDPSSQCDALLSLGDASSMQAQARAWNAISKKMDTLS